MQTIDRNFRSVTGAFVLFIAAASSTTQGANLLPNPGFESATDWTLPAAATRRTTYKHGGSYSLRFDQFAVPANGSASAYQSLSAQPGATYTFSGWVLNPSSFMLTGDNYAVLEIVFSSTSGNTSIPSTHIDSSTLPADVWKQFSTTAVAPAGSTGVAFKMTYFHTDAFSGPMIYFDDMFAEAIEPVPEVSVVWLAAAVPVLAIMHSWRRRRAK